LCRLWFFVSAAEVAGFLGEAAFERAADRRMNSSIATGYDPM
jgi:hypothetical protein